MMDCEHNDLDITEISEVRTGIGIDGYIGQNDGAIKAYEVYCPDCGWGRRYTPRRLPKWIEEERRRRVDLADDIRYN